MTTKKNTKTAKTDNKKFDVYEMVTDRIIEQLEQGVIPWRKPWTCQSGLAVSYSTGKPYGLINQFMLMQGGEYATYEAIQKNGGKVNKDAKAKQIVEWTMLYVDEKDSNGNVIKDNDGKPIKKRVPMLKYVNVFNIEEDTTLEPKHNKAELPKWNDDFELIEAMENIIDDYSNRVNLTINKDELSNEAYYIPAMHSVTVPSAKQFESIAEYYSTMFHELGHSTGHPSLLNREIANKKGSVKYAREELVAEITSASVLGYNGIETTGTFKNSTAYIKSWCKRLKDDKKAIVWASARADKAFRLIMNIEDNEQGKTA